MRRSRFLWKLCFWVSVLLLGVTGYGAYRVGQRVERLSEQSAQRILEDACSFVELSNGAERLREVAARESIDTVFDTPLRKWLQDRDLRVAVLASDGEIRADSEDASGESIAGRMEVLRSLTGSKSLHRGLLSLIDVEGYSWAQPSGGRDSIDYVLFAEVPQSAIPIRPDALEDLWLAVFWPSLFALLAIVAWFARGMDRSLERLRGAVRLMARGEFTELRPLQVRPPLRPLASALGELSVEGQVRVDTIATDRNRLVAILGAMIEGVIAVDPAERVVRMNGAAARILGAQSAAVNGRPIWEVTRVREVADILSQALKSGQEQVRELRIVQPPRDRHVEMRASPLERASGGVGGAVLVLHDVSELRRLEAIRRDFVGNVSHELKTPIAAIRGRVETILEDSEMEPEVRTRFLVSIRDQSMRLSSLVTDLLSLSRVESESALGDMVSLDLRAPVRESVAVLQGPAESKGIELDLDLPGQAAHVRGELESLRLVVNNLVDNAIKYTSAGGRVWIKLRVADGQAVLEVADDGIGIEPKHQSRIFQRFYRVDKARSREVGGTGLGLAIVRHVVLAHGGEITVESQPGIGTTFRVVLAAD